MKFSDMGLSASTLWALEKKWFETPSPIQEACIPLLLGWTKNIIWQAQTGTGKTAAFAIPVIEKIDTAKKVIQAVIIAPTRELAIQIAEEINSLKGTKKISVVQVYGGAPIGKQLRELSTGPQIVVGTPGRMIDMINRWKLKLGKIDMCIFDEADEMLNMWFLDEIEAILEACNPERQMLCFSATMPAAIQRVATRYMGDYELIKVAASQLTTANTEQLCMMVRESDKLEALTRVIDSQPDFYGIVFAKTKRWCDELVATLQANGYQADALHGDLNQKQREKVLNKFKKKRITLLIATDVAARGIDVDDLTHVVNYHLPQDTESYTHRIWRTWRAGKKWIALSLVSKKDQRKIRNIERVTKAKITKIDVPSIKDVIQQKKWHILEKITNAAPADISTNHKELIEKLLADHTEQQIIAWLLAMIFGAQLDESWYKEIRSGWFASETPAWSTRLFIARGRLDKIDGPRDLVERLQHETNVPQKVMDNVTIRDAFSFITCPTAEAEIILDVFKSKPGRTLVSVSKDRDSGGGRWGKKWKSWKNWSRKKYNKGKKGGKRVNRDRDEGGKKKKDKKGKKGKKEKKK